MTAKEQKATTPTESADVQTLRLNVILTHVRQLMAEKDRETVLKVINEFYKSEAVSKSDIRVLQVVEDVVRRAV